MLNSQGTASCFSECDLQHAGYKALNANKVVFEHAVSIIFVSLVGTLSLPPKTFASGKHSDANQIVGG